jgi:Lar family restriction alleviation protein
VDKSGRKGEKNMSWENDKPLPCPFCGAYIKQVELELDSVGKTYWIYCKFCGACGPESSNINLACDKWNRRSK